MKLTNRAKSALATAGYSTNNDSALTQLCAFAAQNSGLDARNYVTMHSHDREGWKAYHQEARKISNDWREFKSLLMVAAIDNVTSDDVIAAAPNAFSGRLEWYRDMGYWEYTTGQYFPTEYRRAAIAVLELAIRNVRLARPPQTEPVYSISDLKRLNEKNGGCWFGRSEMRFFGTRIESGIIGGKYFVTSEQPPHGSRKYSVRSFDEKGDVDTVGEFCAYSDKSEAMSAIRELTLAKAA